MVSNSASKNIYKLAKNNIGKMGPSAVKDFTPLMTGPSMKGKIYFWQKTLS